MMDDVRSEETRMGFHRGSQVRGPRRLFVRIGITVLAVTVLSVMTVGVTPADDQPLPSMTIGYQNGMITAVYEKTLDIDGRTYGLTPDLSIMDEEGNAMEPSSIMRNAAVKFHVKKEQSDKIDKMILIFPK